MRHRRRRRIWRFGRRKSFLHETPAHALPMSTTRQKNRNTSEKSYLREIANRRHTRYPNN